MIFIMAVAAGHDYLQVNVDQFIDFDRFGERVVRNFVIGD